MAKVTHEDALKAHRDALDTQYIPSSDGWMYGGYMGLISDSVFCAYCGVNILSRYKGTHRLRCDA